MTNTFRITWITVFSIVTMLMSSFASSSTAMTMNSQGESAQFSCDHNNAQDAHLMSETHSMSSEYQSHHLDTDDHATTHEQAIKCQVPTTNLHSDTMMGMDCLGGSDSVHDCCVSVCSTTCYPIHAVQAIHPFSPSFACFQSITIGQKVSRTQSLLRPPSV